MQKRLHFRTHRAVSPVTPIGGTKEVPLDIRIITATHRDITDFVKWREFREDLYYRLNVYPIDVPPLRNRKEDIPYLIKYICRRNNWSLNRMNIQDLMTSLRDYDWPGNIRELTNLLERLHMRPHRRCAPRMLTSRPAVR
ncbi:sigma 54-interacting transcriptional regulator [Cytobacillus firmus]|nr:sigma 54-interacting transcriptional regulator [Cytobacillus firmus]URT69027.1 sigma 54-interacting transcriptional regulator [Cytobacillus firmus]